MKDESAGDVQRLIEEYVAGPERLKAAASGLTAEQLRLRPIAGKWSVLEVVCHVADCEQFIADRMKRTLAMDRPLLMFVDEQRYVERLNYHDRDLEEELALLSLTRGQMARILKLAPPEAWQRQAVHTEIGLLTLKELLLRATQHLTHHLSFIEAKRLALGARSAKEV